MRLEPLEERCLLSVFTVNVTDDVDHGVATAEHTSLREAINAANGLPGTDTIAFNIPAAGPHTIRPLSQLPTITDPVVLDGTTQPGFAGTPVIELDGSSAGAANGLLIPAGASTVRGLVINRFSGYGIYLVGAAGNTIAGNYIGTDVTGRQGLANAWGITIQNSAGNTIGGTTAAARNVISANGGLGIWIGGPQANGNTVQGNFVGTDADGTLALGNGESGIFCDTGSDNVIGGTAAGARNVIAANRVDGVCLVGAGGTRNLVAGNYIGTDASGTQTLGNARIGVVVENTSGNTVGGPAPGAGNRIAGGTFGVVTYLPGLPGASNNVIQANEVFATAQVAIRVDMSSGSQVVENRVHANAGIGIQVLGTASGDSLRRNLIYDNAGEDIDLGYNGWLANDPGDDDTGSNGLLNWPEMTRQPGAAPGFLRITGQAAAGATVELFRTTTPYGHQDATAYVTAATADATGAFSVDVPVVDGGLIATATDPAGNTSEFSPAVPTGSAAVDVQYLLVTNEALASAFQPLVDRRTAQGKSGALVTVEWIAAHYDGTRPDGSSDLQTQIRNCVQDYYEHHGTRWVALGGDDTVVPVRNANDVENSPTDLYYAALEGTWDANANGLYGEGQADATDFTAEVYVGRIAVRSAEQAGGYINKLIRYETAPPDGFASSMLLASSLTWYASGLDRPAGYLDHEPVDEGEYPMRDLYRNVIQPHWQAYPLDEMFGTFTTWDTARCGDYGVTRDHMTARLNWGYNYVWLWGHGNPTDGAGIDQAMGQTLTNADRPSVFYVTSCSTAAFDLAEPSTGEAFLRNPTGGAVAYIGGTRSLASTSAYAGLFFREVFEARRATIGQALADSEALFAWDTVNAFRITLLGDPALMLLTEESGRHLQLLSPHGCEVNKSGTQITVRWNAVGTAFVAGEKVRLDYSDDSGQTWHPIPGAGALPYNGAAFDWDATGLPAGEHYRVRVTALADPGVSAGSDRDFKIANLGLLAVQSTPSQTAGNASIRIGGTCPNYTNYTYSVEIGQTVTLTATGQAQYNFVRWTDAGGNTLTHHTTISFAFSEDRTVVAEYEAAGAPRDYYVNDDVADPGLAAGSDENDGLTPQTPMRHLQAVLDHYVDIAVIHVAPGTFQENILITADDPGIVLEGAGAAQTIIDGGQAGSCVRLDTVNNVTLRRMTLRNGKADLGGGGICCTDSGLTISESTLTGNTAVGNGGAVCTSGSTLTVADCVIADNSAGGVGGGIDLWHSSATLRDSEFRDNSANAGGAVFVDNGSTAIITGSTLRRSTAAANGGAVCTSGSTVTVTDSLFDDNSAEGVGGGIDLWYSSATLRDNEFRDNSAAWGGGIYVDNGSTATVTASTFHGNHAANGGAICAAGATTVVTLTNGVLAGNTAASSGGAMVAWNGAALTIINSSFSGNAAEGTAGGLSVFSGSAATLSNCVLWADTAPSGQEISLADGSTLTAGYCDVQRAVASIQRDGNATLTWLAGNIDADPLFLRPPSDGGDGWGVGGNDDYGDLHLSPNSPAIDAGTSTDAPSVDREGNLRPADGNLDGNSAYDLGAYEARITCNLDADGNGRADALTDGILVLRYLFDPSGLWNYSDALGSGAARTTRTTIRSYLDDGRPTVLDVDGNGTPDALTDGILILRYLFDPAGQWNYSDALGSGATRTTRAALKAYLDQFNPVLAPAAGLAADHAPSLEPDADAIPPILNDVASPTATDDRVIGRERPKLNALDMAIRSWGQSPADVTPPARVRYAAWLGRRDLSASGTENDLWDETESDLFAVAGRWRR